ncbi:MAG: lytic murein transglycosylase, partial [Casimicrobiaceae bacterium]
FMPGNVRHYAVDYDGDGKIDLWGSAVDSIGSVANYLARHDWLRGQPIWSRAIVAGSARDAALARLDGGISERRPLEAWNADGIGADRMPVPMMQQPVGLLLLEEDPDAAATRAGAHGDTTGGKPESLWIVFPNFYAITRYNRSRLYASAVTRLAEELRIAQDALHGWHPGVKRLQQ